MPVTQHIPVILNVPVNIPLSETDLGLPFGTLRTLFEPLNGFVGNLPESNRDFFDRFQRSLQVPADADVGPQQAELTTPDE